jgi:hypothetical protein
MAGIDFRLPGMQEPLDSPESYVTGALRAFGSASQALGVAVEALVLRLGTPSRGGAPDYQIQTMDAEDAAVFSGETHNFKHDDITIRLEEDEMSDQTFTAEQVKDWLNVINGEGTAGGPIDPILSDRWLDSDISDPRG